MAEEGKHHRAIQALPKRSMDELRQIWLNLLDRKSRATRNPELTELAQFREALVAEWQRRSAVAIIHPDRFEWPSTEAHIGTGTLNTHDWPDEGMLGYLGYRVGTTKGRPKGVRRDILDLVFESALPPVNSREYLLDWDEPGGPARLRKLAETLAALTRNAKRRESASMDSAIAEWESDLQYLYDRYYVGRFSFDWPSLNLVRNGPRY